MSELVTQTGRSRSVAQYNPAAATCFSIRRSGSKRSIAEFVFLTKSASHAMADRSMADRSMAIELQLVPAFIENEIAVFAKSWRQE
jgi:hypothetical protein